MSYKTILVQGGANAAAEARIKAALTVGQAFDAALIVAAAEAWNPYPVMTENAFVSPELIQAMRDALDSRLREARLAYDRLCANRQPPAEWRQAVYFPDFYLTELAKGADLIIAGRPQPGDTHTDFANPETLVMQAAAPVLLVPPRAESVAAETVVVAWKDAPEARRALADSLPFLKRAKTVILLEVVPAGAASPKQHDVLERLRRHGVEVVPDIWTSSSLGDGHDLLEAAAAHHADMIVAGAYGHSRLREWVFGGVTRTLLKSAAVPVLFSR